MIFLTTFSSLFLTTRALLAATPAVTAPQDLTAVPPPHVKGTCTSSYMSISIKERTDDLKNAFDILRKEKTAGKVYFQLADGTSITNIIDMTPLPNNSLIFFRYNTNNQGIKLQIVKVEDIVGLSYY